MARTGKQMDIKYCQNEECAKLLCNPSSCARCKTAIYCCKNCQTRGWERGHKIECKLLIFSQKKDWKSILELKKNASWWTETRNAFPKISMQIYDILGTAYYKMKSYEQAWEMYKEHKAICEVIGNRGGEAKAYLMIGHCHTATRDYVRALEAHEQCMHLHEIENDSKGMGKSYWAVADCHKNLNNHEQALVMYEKHRVNCEERNDKKGLSASYSNLGACFYTRNNHEQAKKMFEQYKRICEQLKDLSGIAAAHGAIAHCYMSTGNYDAACILYNEQKILSQEIKDLHGFAIAQNGIGKCLYVAAEYERAYEVFKEALVTTKPLKETFEVVNLNSSLAECCLSTGQYQEAITRYKEAYNIAKMLNSKEKQQITALGVGVTLQLYASQKEEWSESKKWLELAFVLGSNSSNLHLARLHYNVDALDIAVEYLEEYLRSFVQNARMKCAGCEQVREPEITMLLCNGCRVARFCNVEHQKMASNSRPMGQYCLHGKHRDLCGLLRKWKYTVVKGGNSTETLREDMLNFLCSGDSSRTQH